MARFSCNIYFLGLCLINQNTKGCDFCENYRFNYPSVTTPFKVQPNYQYQRTPDLIRKLGYPVESHELVTEDGYILTLYRIPSSRHSGPSFNKIPILCMHGALSSSAHWVWQPVQRALVFLLADAGYDVWLGNSRGTSYSQKHVFLPVDNPNDLRYWDFSQTEYSKYDVPAFVNFILNWTSQPSLYWIGHSIGAGQVIGALGYHPELNYKIRTLFALAPAVFAGNTSNLAERIVAPLYSKPFFSKIATQIGNGRLIPNSVQESSRRLTSLCQIHFLHRSICFNLIQLISAVSRRRSLPGISTQLPDVVSVKTFSHYMQLLQSGEFQEYDYGKSGNIERYGQTTPPDFDFSRVHVPIVIYHSRGDTVVVPQDVRKTVGALGSNVMEVNEIPHPNFSHSDFVTGVDAHELVYKHIIDTMNSRKYDRAY